jgi:hypothetical protein
VKEGASLHHLSRHEHSPPSTIMDQRTAMTIPDRTRLSLALRWRERRPRPTVAMSGQSVVPSPVMSYTPKRRAAWLGSRPPARRSIQSGAARRIDT